MVTWEESMAEHRALLARADARDALTIEATDPKWRTHPYVAAVRGFAEHRGVSPEALRGRVRAAVKIALANPTRTPADWLPVIRRYIQMQYAEDRRKGNRPPRPARVRDRRVEHFGRPCAPDLGALNPGLRGLPLVANSPLVSKEGRKRVRLDAQLEERKAREDAWHAEVRPYLGHPYVNAIRWRAYQDDSPYARRSIMRAVRFVQRHPEWSAAEWGRRAAAVNGTQLAK